MAMRTALVGLSLLGLLALAAAGSAGEDWGGGPEDRAIPGAFVDYAFTLSVVVLAILAGVVIWAFTGPRADVKVERPKGMNLVGFAFLAFVLISYYAFTERRAAPQQLQEEGASRGQPTLSDPPPPGFDDTPGPEFQWWVAISAALVVAALVVYERRRGRPERAERAAAEALEEVLTETLEEVELDPDPRRAVIQAYVRMEAVLAAHGHARLPHEAPLEYLARVLRRLEVRPEAAHALTELFERARFSHHEIDAAMRAEAVASLEAVRDDLRDAA